MSFSAQLARLVLCLALTISVAYPVAAQSGRDIQRITNYLNAQTTLQGRFVQTNPDGSISEGRFFIQRPGFMRFEYAPPNPALVIADGVWVAVMNRRKKQNAQRYPLSETPLDLLLRDRVDLRSEGAVKNVERKGGQIRMTAIDPGAPQRGQITLVFNDNPLELRQWIIRDDRNKLTTVILSSVQRGVKIRRDLFSIEAAEANPNNNVDR